MASAIDIAAVKLGPPPADMAETVHAATGASIAELLAPAAPPWHLLAIIIAPMIDDAPAVPELAHALSVSGITAAEWAARIATAIDGDA